MLGISGGVGDRRMNSWRHRLHDYMWENPKVQVFLFFFSFLTIEKTINLISKGNSGL